MTTSKMNTDVAEELKTTITESLLKLKALIDHHPSENYDIL